WRPRPASNTARHTDPAPPRGIRDLRTSRRRAPPPPPPTGLPPRDQVYVRASTVIVPFDFEAQRPRRITQEEREFLLEYTDDGDSEGDAADATEEEAVAA
ncbi:hypothetical protein ACFVZ0_16430, partial [Streptomyces prasinus]